MNLPNGTPPESPDPSLSDVATKGKEEIDFYNIPGMHVHANGKNYPLFYIHITYKGWLSCPANISIKTWRLLFITKTSLLNLYQNRSNLKHES